MDEHKENILLRFIVSLVFSVALVVAATPTIGTITSNGRFHMNGTETWNQGALLDGTILQTEKSALRLLLRNGTDLRVGASSQSQVFSDRIVLESGAVEGLLPHAFRLETTTLGIQVQGENARAHVNVADGKILVASLNGALSVRGAQGMLIASLLEGNAVQLSPSGNEATAGVELTGVVTHKDYRYFLTDETTGVTVELKGESVAKQVGTRVTLTGEIDTAAVPAGKAEYVVRVTRLEVPSSSAAAAGAGAKAVGLSTAGKMGIIGGIAVAGATTTGLVVAGSGEDKPTVSTQP